MLSGILPLSCSPSPFFFFLIFLNDHTMFEIWKGQCHHEYKNTCMPHTFINRSLNQDWTTEHSGSLVYQRLSCSLLLFPARSAFQNPPASLYSCLHSLDIFSQFTLLSSSMFKISVWHRTFIRTFWSHFWFLNLSLMSVCRSVCLWCMCMCLRVHKPEHRYTGAKGGCRVSCSTALWTSSWAGSQQPPVSERLSFLCSPWC